MFTNSVPKAFLFRTDARILAALELWAAADSRSLNKQIEYLLLRALFLRGLDPTDHAYEFPLLEKGKPTPAYLSLTARRRKSTGQVWPKGRRPPPDDSPEPPPPDAQISPSPNHPHGRPPAGSAEPCVA